MEHDTQALKKRALYVAYFIIAWDLIEGIVAVAAGLAADSIALLGFGIDSGIEVFAATVVAWQLRGSLQGHPGEQGRVKVALRLIALTFFVLAAYVAFESISDLLTQDRAAPSPVGIVLNVVALLVMVPTAIVQRRTGRMLSSAVVIAQSQETWISNYLSISLLVGLGANALFGWWWADPVVALLIAGVAGYSGVEAWREAGEASEEPEQRGRTEEGEAGSARTR
jgi:divalent metal cation (Fe/Co/Zn/Cd) transporter